MKASRPSFWNLISTLVEEIRRFKQAVVVRSIAKQMGLTMVQGAQIMSIDRLTVGTNVVLDSGCYLHCGNMSWCKGMGSIVIGDNSYVGPRSVLFGMGGIRIGSDVMISPVVTITSVQHPTDNVTVPMYRQPRLYGEVVIEDDVYIGSNAVVVPGKRIGRGSVVAAGAVVVDDVEPFSVVAGVPARVVKKRR